MGFVLMKWPVIMILISECSVPNAVEIMDWWHAVGLKLRFLTQTPRASCQNMDNFKLKLESIEDILKKTLH